MDLTVEATLLPGRDRKGHGSIRASCLGHTAYPVTFAPTLQASLPALL